MTRIISLKTIPYNVVILAAGLSSRLKPLTNEIPKPLVNIGHEPAIVRQSCIWRTEHMKHMYVIVHPKYISFFKAVLKTYNIKWISLVAEDKSDGSYNSLVRFFNKHPAAKENVYICWSDIIPGSIPTPSNKNATIFTHGSEHRFKAEDGKIIECKNGNVPGLYHFDKFPFDTEWIESEYDRAPDLIEKLDDIGTVKVSNLIDFGDLEKLCKANSGPRSRDFNEVIINADVTTKRALNSHGKHLQVKELAWYDFEPSNVPAIFSRDKDEFKMETLTGSEIYKIYDRKLLRPILNALEDLHQTKEVMTDQTIIYRDVRKEVIFKSIARRESIQTLIDGFGEVKSVNGLELLSFEELMPLLADRILNTNEFTESYHFIHGDPNLSNTFYDDTTDTIQFIDPRGYFGDTEILGLPSYDYSKILYGLSGYDKFNNEPTFGEYGLIDGELTLNIEPLDPDFLNLTDYFSEQEYYWLAVIWNNLGGYFKNNPIKAVVAYYYGLYLATHMIEKRYVKKRNGFNEFYRPIEMKIVTKVPTKWLLHDKETTGDYLGAGMDIAGKMWNKQ